MTFTFNAAAWKNVRPKSAEGSGVAAAIKEFTKVVQKDVGDMNTAEVEKARKATQAVVKAFDTGLGKIKSNDPKAPAAKKAIGGWKTECENYLRTLQQRDYAIHLSKVQAAYEHAYRDARNNVVQAHAAAKQAEAVRHGSGDLPENKLLMNWAGVARNSLKVCAKPDIKKMQGIGMEQVRVEDLFLPKDLKDTKAKIDEINQILTVFAKEAKRTSRAAGAGLDDNKAVEAELKGILADFDTVDGQMKPVIRNATAVANEAKSIAETIKRLIPTRTDPVAFQPSINRLKELVPELDQLEQDVKDINFTYRESTGKLAVRKTNWKKMPGYNEAAHGKIVTKRQEAAFMGIRRATVPITEGKRQVERARDLFKKSPSHRGYAAAI
jgi:uncharacterized phage infection (PIP) family protein YhgE